MNKRALLMFIVTALPPARGVAEISATELMARPECPAALARYQGGLGSEEQAGVIVAVWRDGTIVRAADPKKPWQKHIVGKVEAKDMQTLAAILDHGDIWDSPRGEVGIDLPQEWLVLQRGDRHWAWWESPGVTRTRWLQETAFKLLRFHLRSEAALVGSFDAKWECMDGRLQHDVPSQSTVAPRARPK